MFLTSCDLYKWAISAGEPVCVCVCKEREGRGSGTNPPCVGKNEIFQKSWGGGGGGGEQVT